MDMLEIHFIELPKVVEYNKDDELSAWVVFFNSIKVMSQDEKEREAYNMREKALHDMASLIREGEIKGEIKKGIEGVKKALKKGFDIQDIAEITDLSEDEILKIKQEMNL